MPSELKERKAMEKKMRGFKFDPKKLNLLLRQLKE